MDALVAAIANLNTSGAASPPLQLPPSGSTQCESWDVILQTPGVHIGHRIGLCGELPYKKRTVVALGLDKVAVSAVAVPMADVAGAATADAVVVYVGVRGADLKWTLLMMHSYEPAAACLPSRAAVRAL